MYERKKKWKSEEKEKDENLRDYRKIKGERKSNWNMKVWRKKQESDKAEQEKEIKRERGWEGWRERDRETERQRETETEKTI